MTKINSIMHSSHMNELHDINSGCYVLMFWYFLIVTVADVANILFCICFYTVMFLLLVETLALCPAQGLQM